MPLKTIAPQRIYQRIAAQIADMIRAGEFIPGQRLPPERDLAKTFGVSRNVVREAMVALEMDGLVTVRLGSGTFVANVGGGSEPADLCLARTVIECEIAALAAENRTESDLVELREAAEQAADEADDGRRGTHWNRRFHVLLAETTRNAVLAAVVRQLWGGPEPASRLDGAACLMLLQAVARRDAQGARAAMRTHLHAADTAVPAVTPHRESRRA